MKQMLRSSLSTVLYRSRVLFGPKETGTRILSYHRVDDGDARYFTVPVARFREQMRFLAEEGYRTAGVKDVLEGRAGTKSVVITFDDGFRDIYENAFPILAEYGFSATLFLIGKRVGEEAFLKKSEIQEMHRKGFEFGSHTLAHPNLPELAPDQKWWEIFGSKRYLEELLGFPFDLFCYPFGQYDRESIRMVERAGYQGACSNRPGANKTIEPYLLRRTEISHFDTLYDFEKKMAGAYDLLHQGLHWMRGRP